MTDDEQQPRCKLCSQFISDVISFKFKEQDSYSSDRWTKKSTAWSDWGDFFHHYDTFSELQSSASSCDLCHIIAEDFGEEEQSAKTWLSLFPFGRHFRCFVAAYDKKTNGRMYGLRDPHTFVFGRRRPYDTESKTDEPSASGWVERQFFRAIPDKADDQDAIETARYCLKECLDTHEKCARESSSLPTRVIEIGLAPSDPVKLFVTGGEVQPYVALSHCWGGDIPCKTTQASLKEHQNGLPVEQLPRNFQDAISMTRALGFRYLWIDALCIIQDSPEDWHTEAAKMASVYRNCFVTLSAMDAESSTAGFLKPRSSRQVIVNGDFAVRRELLPIADVLERCRLNTRAWCMQERLLSPALLHFSQEQLFWECRAGVSSEVEGKSSLSSYPTVSTASFNYVTTDFITLRQTFGSTTAPTTDLAVWYKLVEEFSTRALTFGADKLPALAGAAERFRANGVGGDYYVAGLWAAQMPHGLCWGPRTRRMPRQKAPGFHACEQLARPTQPRAPTWSWASVDGPVEFRAAAADGLADPALFRVLQVDCSAGYDDLAATQVVGTLTLRAPVARMQYRCNASNDHVGHVKFEHDDEAVFTAVMDFDRKTSRDCWVALTARSRSRGDVQVLLLEEGAEGHFQRVGFGHGGSTVSDQVFQQFTQKDIVLA